MLILARKLGEQIVIGESIRLTVVSIRGNQVRLALTAPADTLILRGELCARDRSGGQAPGSDSPARDSAARIEKASATE
jgi:carbon storage regulator